MLTQYSVYFNFTECKTNFIISIYPYLNNPFFSGFFFINNNNSNKCNFQCSY